MRTMTRPEFEEYEKRVEDVLARIEDSIGKADLEDFLEVAAAAREVVEMRRVYLEIAERQSEHVKERHDDWPTQPAATSERYFEKTAEAANDALNEIRIAREALGKIEANEHSILPASAYRGDLDRGLEMAAKLAVQWNNHHVLEAAQVDTELAERIVLYEKNWEEHDISYGAGSAGEPIPEITKGDAQLLGYYKEGLDNHKSDLAIADAENGLSYGSWAFGPSLGYWSHEDSDAAWENFSQRRNELLAAHTRLEQGAEIPNAETLLTVAANDAERAPHSGDDLASHADRSGQTAEAADWARFREEAVAHHGEKAVADGEELIERLVEAGREVRHSEARLGRYRESDEERQGRFEQLIEATASYNQLLRQAAREAVDGNGYIREARWHRDLESAIAMEDLRHEQRAQFYVQSEGRESDTAEQPFQADGTGRPTAPEQQMTRLRQIEQEIQERGRTDRDERDR